MEKAIFTYFHSSAAAADDDAPEDVQEQRAHAAKEQAQQVPLELQYLLE